MQVSRNVIDAEDWANESSLSERGRIGRRDTLKRLLKTNGKATFAELFEDIRTDKITVYSACKKFVDTMRKDGLKPSVVYVHRSRLPELFQSVLGEENFSKTVFNRLVPKGDSYVTTRKAIPTWEQVKYMLKISTPQYRCLIASLATAGWRIMEALTRKMSDLEIREKGYARIKLQARETKAREFRYVFLPKEVVDMVKVYHLSVSSEWIFPGEKGNHLSYAGAEEQIKRTFEKAGLTDAEDGSEAYSPHSFRTVADSRMGKAGLDRKYIELLIGHSGVLGASNSYKDWTTVEQEWFSKCEHVLSFEEPRVVETKWVQDPRVDKLARVVKAQARVVKALLKERTKEMGDLAPETEDILLEGTETKELEDKSGDS